MHAIVLYVAILLPLCGHALPVSHYSSSSVLASGKWAKVKVSDNGMQFLSNSQLKNLGFSDPDKVNVYGYGGRIISETLDSRQIDDLPLLPVVRTANGILFFGVNSILWKKNSATTYGQYSHRTHDYEEASYYFISDREIQAHEMETDDRSSLSGNTITSFIERTVHENDLTPQGRSGRNVLGEDFLSTSTRTFPFTLPGNIGTQASVTSRFICRTTSGTSEFSLSAGGKTFGNVSVGSISNDKFISTAAKKQLSVPVTDEKLDIQIKAGIPKSGVNYFATLDYLKIEYERELRMTGSELYFYLPANISGTVELTGCSENTILWDVTETANPKKINFNLDGQTIRFSHSGGTYREYIAFDPTRSTRAPAGAGSVANQDLHSLPVPDMLIVTPKEFLQQAERIAEMRRRVDGFIVHVLTPDLIYNEFSCGTRDVSAIRKALKMWHDRESDDTRQIRYCLIMSRPSFDNKALTPSVKNGIERIPIWFNPSKTDMDNYEGPSFSTDDILGMLDDDTGESDIKDATIYVAVGRMPVKNVTEATQMTDKLIKYVEEPELGSWRNNILLIADDQDRGTHLNQTEGVYSNITADPVGASYFIEKLYFDAYPIVSSGSGLTYPGPRAKYAQKIDEGVMYVSYIGHGHAKGLAHENFLTWTDITSVSNTRLPFFYTATCIFTPWDSEDDTAGEELYLNPTSGYIGLISTNRSTIISNNGSLSQAMAQGIFSRQPDGTRRRVGDIYRSGKNKVTDENKLCFIIVGDPALQLPVPLNTVSIDSIATADLTDPDASAPVLGARGRVPVSGRILGLDGQTDTDFNGTVELTLFDAEKVITTYGNHGETEGKTLNYNDRSSRLCRVNASVKNGTWSTTLLIPSEIENNTAPALITAYGYSDNGIEANGHTDRLHVYGFDQSAPEDNEGPVISRFTLNSDAFRDGGAVNSTPLVLASFYDQSGINMSTVGIGHAMTITLDGKKTFTDVVNSYTPSLSDPCSGSLSYILDKVEPGDHTLDLTVWDNAGNFSSASLRFTVAAHANPVISSLSTDANPAKSGVTFTLTTEMPEPGSECVLDVFDLNGRRLWTHSTSINSTSDAIISVRWDLCDSAGHRVPRGIYLYRATLRTSSGIVDSVTKKLAVAAQ